KGHFNTFVTDGMVAGGPYIDLLEQQLAMYKWADDDYVQVLATAWETKGDNLEVKLRDGVKWSDGTAFTADDVVTTYTIYRMLKDPIWKYVDKIEAKDKLTVVFHMARPSTVVLRYALRYPIRANSVYGDWARKVSDAAAKDPNFESDATKQLRLDFEKFRPKEMVTTGPFKIDVNSITEAQLTLVKVPTAWNASIVQFDKLVLYNGETPTVTPLVLGKRTDYATHGFPPATEKEFESKGIRIIRPPTYTGPGIFFNFKNEAFQKTEVRQAIAYIIDRVENGTVALGKSGIAVQQMTGFSDNLVANWLSPEDMKKLNTYPHDVKKAEELLTKIGFKKGPDGTWLTDKGVKMEYELMVPSEFADWSAAAENAAQQLTRFGIKTTVRGVTFAQVPVDIDAGKFQIAIQPWGAANPHPHFSYVNNLFLHNYVQANGPGMSFQMKQKSAAGDIDFQELVIGSADGLDQAKQKAAVTKVALAFNELLPIIPLFERYGNNAAISDHVDGWPADGDPILKNGLYADNPIVLLIQTGVVKPK
ncbi:MAG: extracellular solute-binding protein family 5, partial [Firmicutes bacterium]|nr:extracellular solute-binding protein family 5 [Bacillota bacterium]